MPVIKLATYMNAPIEVVFDLSRSIDLHKISTGHTLEEAIAGKTSGLIEMDETVTWRARHFGVYQALTTKITSLNRPYQFTDEMASGAFKSFRHDHLFEERDGIVILTDVFDYKSPFGVLGRFADFLFLKSYMKRLLEKRNDIIKEFAEDDTKYKKILPL